MFKAAVVGAGTMGAGIAQVAAEAGYRVMVREVSHALLQKGLGRIDSFLQKGVDKGKVTPEGKTEVMGRLQGTTDLAALAACDIVIEAVFEDMELKKRTFADLARVMVAAARKKGVKLGDPVEIRSRSRMRSA